MKKILNDSFSGKIIKTFIEGFIASIIIAIPNISNFEDFNLIKSIIMGSVAMGISSVLNLIQKQLEKIDE